MPSCSSRRSDPRRAHECYRLGQPPRWPERVHQKIVRGHQNVKGPSGGSASTAKHLGLLFKPGLIDKDRHVMNQSAADFLKTFRTEFAVVSERC